MTQPPAPAQRRNPVAIIAVAAIAVLALVGAVFLGAKLFGGDNPAQTASGTQPTSAASAPASPAASPSPAPAMNAKAVLDALATAGLPLAKIAEQDESTDPNGKLGRPGNYISRASADVPGGDKYSIERGLVVEVFATVEDADARSAFIQDALKKMQVLGSEYHYRPADRRILVRLTGMVKPSQAKKYETAVAGLAR